MSYPGLRILTLVPCLFAGLFAGCGGDAAVEFGSPRTVSREQRPTKWDVPTRERLGLPEMKPPPSKPADAPKRWTGATPTGWEALPSDPGRFRELLWRIAGNADTECYLAPGVGGGVAMNMARWYTAQFGIQEVPALESLPIVEIAGRPGRLVELAGTFMQKQGVGMLLAFFAEGEQVTSLKFTGPEAVVLGNKEQFLGLAKSLRTATVGPNKDAPTIERGQPMPADHVPIPGADPNAKAGPAVPAAAPFTATVPAGWTVKAGSQRLLHYTFGGDGEVYLNQLGGSLKQTLDIWRGGMQLPALSDAEFQALPKVPMLGTEGTLLDIAGNYSDISGKQVEGARVLVAAQVDGNAITFVKLVGKAVEVEVQREAFLQFCASLRRAP